MHQDLTITAMARYGETPPERLSRGDHGLGEGAPFSNTP